MKESGTNDEETSVAPAVSVDIPPGNPKVSEGQVLLLAACINFAIQKS
eukprot:CAMPEP_0206463486 /NCGR_PEP_ID=MMETSP0324_2-20121206/26638_1 /ASSEMBLY_ACC=CAM_ASM_000836 /TAXON_ID=2866 /ORGANISM="Crypthecodinium cohnii, Strain Seligo" /LENGTH=47 /DNA_ID= /DNA_START= /DNA_END= /DNA_ORIENTATION=